MEKAKHRYFDACKLAVDQEKIVLKVLEEKDANLASEGEIKVAHGIFINKIDNLFKMRSLSENYCQFYKNELV